MLDAYKRAWMRFGLSNDQCYSIYHINQQCKVKNGEIGSKTAEEMT